MHNEESGARLVLLAKVASWCGSTCKLAVWAVRNAQAEVASEIASLFGTGAHQSTTWAV